MTPFLSFFTPTYRRPMALAKCLASVGAQTLASEIEQIVVPDHVGVGIVDGLYGRIPIYADALHGQYVHILCDDDVLASPVVVQQVQDFAVAEGFPPVIVVRVRKGTMELPSAPIKPPTIGTIDLACFILRADVFRMHANDYGKRYEGDFDHAAALDRAGWPFAFCDFLFVVGAQSRGVAEAAA